ncbi:hypothetical protein WBG78_01400 [Chryseolinea sp. T2]|uniref:hypothetical protein n=1 Tax=Chryseolinea sp. T2 TaxID=3129255 RepID=UPI003076D2B8
MKIKGQLLLLTIFFAMLMCVVVQSARAQDASYPAVETVDSESEHARERVIYGGEGDPMVNNKIHVAVSSRDSSIVKPAKTVKADAPKPTAKPASQEDDSILSFNFLYYIFEKYKMQDVVD